MLAEKLRLNTVPERLWQHISVDFIMKLLVSRSHNLILVVFDRFPKIFATIEKIMAESLAKLFRYNVWKLHGLSENVILDRDLQFTARLIKELNKMLEIETKLLTAFHP